VLEILVDLLRVINKEGKSIQNNNICTCKVRVMLVSVMLCKSARNKVEKLKVGKMSGNAILKCIVA
jgi:hypothetical protein